MNEAVKDSAAAVAADMLEREFQIDADTAERIARRVMSVLLPPLEKEVDRHDDARRSQSLIAGRDVERCQHVLDQFARFIESMLRYANSIRPSHHGHYIDVPVDDRTAQELNWLLTEWQRVGGKRHDIGRVEWAIDYGREDIKFRDDIKFGRRDDLFKNGPTLSQIEELSRRIDLGTKADTLKIAEERIRREQESPGGNRRPTET
jgi:hypothetical protein